MLVLQSLLLIKNLQNFIGIGVHFTDEINSIDNSTDDT